MKNVLKIGRLLIPMLLLTVAALFFIQNCTKEKIIIYKPPTEKVTLLYPPSSGSVFDAIPALSWESLDEAVAYQVQLAGNAAFSDLVFTRTVTDTFYADTTQQENGLYYWRVRAKNIDDVWGDWSDADIWSFSINNNSDYIGLLSVIQTPGTANDVFVVEEETDSVIAYIADGHSLLTVVNVSNRSEPWMVGNIDTYIDDIAKSLWKVQGDDIVYVADMDGKILTIDTQLPFDPYSFRNLSLGWDQNIEDIAGIVYLDTIYVFTVGSGLQRRKLMFNQIVYENDIPMLGPLYDGIVSPFELPSDGKGVCFDSMTVVVEYSNNDSTYFETQNGMFVFGAISEGGLWWINISQTHTFDGTDSLLLWNPVLLGTQDTPSLALSVFADNGFAYVADDRGGLQIFDLPDTIPSFDHADSTVTADPVLVANINTSGRVKDVHIVGNYCYLADGSGGLKVIDVSNPYAPVFLAAYGTPYAYGVWADENFVYITDRDNGLMIFEKR